MSQNQNSIVAPSENGLSHISLKCCTEQAG
jgi:hypothetical protein